VSESLAGPVGYLLVALLAYLLGSIPTGAIVARLYRNVDLTAVGSARTGATNALRTLGPGAGVIVLLGDLMKGMLAVLAARELVGTPFALGVAGFFATLGHTRSIFLGFKGGRGVVTGLGGLAVASTGLFILACLTGCVVAATTRYISLGSILGCAMALIGGLAAYAAGYLPIELLPYIVVTPLFVIAAHSDNIERLRAGTERRLGQREATR
jgi:acyl phosphate:glycerol-3-phosphate acyltransferase